jgi:NAD(P)H dehydrogenase (quinone)
MFYSSRRVKTVAIVGAGGQVGTALRGRLARERVEVRPLGRADDLHIAIKDADAVVHLAGALRPRHPDTYQQANLDTVAATCAAMKDSSARRVLFLSFPGAAARSANPYLRSKGEAERLLGGCGVPAVIFRCAHIFGPPERPGPTASAMLARRRSVVWVLGSGSQRYAWVALQDVAEILARAVLDLDPPAGTFVLAGPRAYPVDEFVRHINSRPVRIRHLPPWASRAAGRVVPALPWPLVDVMLHDCLPDAGVQDAAAAFGVTQHPLTQIWPGPGSQDLA